MKTEHTKNTWTNRQDGANGQLAKEGGGVKRANCQGDKWGKKCHRGALPLLPHSYSLPLTLIVAKMRKMLVPRALVQKQFDFINRTDMFKTSLNVAKICRSLISKNF